jgi:uncharacterized protein (DUF697 family)
MAGISNLSNMWNTIKEVDLRPIRNEALKGIKIAIVGAQGSGRKTLVSQMHRDPLRPVAETQTPVGVFDLDDAGPALEADLIILLINQHAQDIDCEKALARGWADAGKKVLVVINQVDVMNISPGLGQWVNWQQRRVVSGSVDDTAFLLGDFSAAVIDLLPESLLTLGRFFPLFRTSIAHSLINETSLSNAAYALATGLATVVPILDVPLNVADMLVLTKAQAFLVYKLGLALGFSTHWQDYVAEFGSVLGGGFLWRQLARSLVGLIPAWGIIPSVSVAYAGTYVVGHVVLQWYLTGRKITTRQMRELYGKAFAQGKQVAQALLSKAPKKRLGKGKVAALPAGKAAQVCPRCGRSSAADASFCQYCGQSFADGGGAPAEK